MTRAWMTATNSGYIELRRDGKLYGRYNPKKGLVEIKQPGKPLAVFDLEEETLRMINQTPAEEEE